MEVVVDGKTGWEGSQVGGTLQDVFESLRRFAAGRRRRVVSFSLDGELLSRRRQEALGSRPSAGFSLLEVKTIDPFQLSAETLSGLLGHTENLERAHDEAASRVVSGDYTQALKKLEECFHGWEIMVRAVSDIGLLTSVDFETLRAGGEPVSARIRKLEDALRRFKDAFETKDVVRLGDVAGHELKPLLREWREILAALGGHIDPASGAVS